MPGRVIGDAFYIEWPGKATFRADFLYCIFQVFSHISYRSYELLSISPVRHFFLLMLPKFNFYSFHNEFRLVLSGISQSARPKDTVLHRTALTLGANCKFKFLKLPSFSVFTRTHRTHWKLLYSWLWFVTGKRYIKITQRKRHIGRYLREFQT